MDENSGTTPPVAPPPSSPSSPAPMTGGRPGPASDTSKILAALGYIFGLIAVVALLIDPYKEEKFVKFHAIQAVAIWIAEFVLGVVWVVPVIGWIIGAVGSIALFVLAVIGLIKAFSGEYWEAPLIYGVVKGWLGE